jgi:hypothetical protein
LLTVHAINAQTRIRFARGAVNAVVGGDLKSYRDKRTYIIRVRSGQTLKTARVGNRYITIFVRDPNGEVVGDSDASCNDRREIEPTISGNYKIEVVECRKADPWRGRFRFRVTVR